MTIVLSGKLFDNYFVSIGQRYSQYERSHQNVQTTLRNCCLRGLLHVSRCRQRLYSCILDPVFLFFPPQRQRPPRRRSFRFSGDEECLFRLNISCLPFSCLSSRHKNSDPIIILRESPQTPFTLLTRNVRSFSSSWYVRILEFLLPHAVQKSHFSKTISKLIQA